MSAEVPGIVDGKVLGIRPARQDDLDHLLWQGEHLRANRQAILDLQQRGEVVVLLPTLDDVPIGHMAMELMRLQDAGGVYLYWLEVRQEFKRKGIASALIKQAERLATEMGRRFSEIAVGKDNPEARQIYERLGYRLIGEREDRWIADRPDGSHVEVVDTNLVLRKSLANAPSNNSL